jgi:hypothetical protein
MAPLLIGPYGSRVDVTVIHPPAKEPVTASIVRMPALDQSLLTKLGEYQRAASGAGGGASVAAVASNKVHKLEEHEKETLKTLRASAPTADPVPDTPVSVLSVEYKVSWGQGGGKAGIRGW